MLDPRFVLENAQLVAKNCRDRQVSVDIESFLDAENNRRALSRQLQDLQAQINALARTERMSVEDRRSRGRILKDQQRKTIEELASVQSRADAILRTIPNLTHPEAPRGSANASKEIYRSHRAPRLFSFAAKDHKELCERLGMLDMEAGAKVAKSGFYFLKGDLALLEIALMRFALDRVVARGYVPHIVPELARNSILLGTGYNPRGPESNTFEINDADLSLIATAEIPLCGMYSDQILPVSSLPIRVSGVSHCFRTERAAGRASRGLFRVHQFLKVEMVALCQPDQSSALHEEMLSIEKEVFDDLEIPYRVLDIASGDLGGPAYRKFDLEAFMPGRSDSKNEPYGEVTSASNCTDYQARRLNIRFRDAVGKTHFVHTLNGTALAVGRAMLTIVENCQQEDGSIEISHGLQQYLGKTRIARFS